MMRQVGFKMKLKAGNEEEYLRRHQEIWPALTALLKEQGVYDYAIYLDEETLDLFAVQKLHPQFDDVALRSNPVMKEWWEYMKDLMDVNPDNSPKSYALKEVFYLP